MVLHFLFLCRLWWRSTNSEDDCVAANTGDRQGDGEVSVQGRILRKDDDETCYGISAWTFLGVLDGKLILRSRAGDRCHNPRTAYSWIEIVCEQHDTRTLIRGHIHKRG